MESAHTVSFSQDVHLKACFPLLTIPIITTGCIGRVVALQELRLGLASLLFKYDFKFASGFQMNQIDFGDRFLLNFKVPIPVILTKREGKQVEYPKLM